MLIFDEHYSSRGQALPEMGPKLVDSYQILELVRRTFFVLIFSFCILGVYLANTILKYMSYFQNKMKYQTLHEIVSLWYNYNCKCDNVHIMLSSHHENIPI